MIRFLYILLLFPLLWAGCNSVSNKSGASIVKGEYYLRMGVGHTENIIADVLEAYRPREIIKIKDSIYLVVLAKDPGLERLKDLALERTELRDVSPRYIINGESRDRKSRLGRFKKMMLYQWYFEKFRKSF